MIHSDWHIHSENSYDATNSLEEILQEVNLTLMDMHVSMIQMESYH